MGRGKGSKERRGERRWRERRRGERRGEGGEKTGERRDIFSLKENKRQTKQGRPHLKNDT